MATLEDDQAEPRIMHAGSTRTEMYAGCVTCCSRWVMLSRHMLRALYSIVEKRRTDDGRMDRQQTVTLRFPLVAASVTMTPACCIMYAEPSRRTEVEHYETNWTESASICRPVDAKRPQSHCSRRSLKVCSVCFYLHLSAVKCYDDLFFSSANTFSRFICIAWLDFC